VWQRKRSGCCSFISHRLPPQSGQVSDEGSAMADRFSTLMSPWLIAISRTRRSGGAGTSRAGRLPTSLCSRGAIAPSGTQWSTRTLSMALCGISGSSAVAGSCTIA
jgi:hypothetical protein